jgi:hypothetical protein
MIDPPVILEPPLPVPASAHVRAQPPRDGGVAWVSEMALRDEPGRFTNQFRAHWESGDGRSHTDGPAGVTVEEALAWARARARVVLVTLGDGKQLYSAGVEDPEGDGSWSRWNGPAQRRDADTVSWQLSLALTAPPDEVAHLDAVVRGLTASRVLSGVEVVQRDGGYVVSGAVAGERAVSAVRTVHRLFMDVLSQLGMSQGDVSLRIDVHSVVP